VLSQQDIHVPDSTGPFVVERPKVIYNTKTALYVMWFHLDNANYGYRHAGVATSSVPQGPFKVGTACVQAGYHRVPLAPTACLGCGALGSFSTASSRTASRPWT
jgi:hypothetical protein